MRLQMKITMLIVFVILLGGVGSALLLGHFVAQGVRTELQQSALNSVDSLLGAAEADLASNATQELTDHLNQLVTLDNDITYALVTDENGQVIISTLGDDALALVAGVMAQHQGLSRTLVSSVNINDKNYYHVSGRATWNDRYRVHVGVEPATESGYEYQINKAILVVCLVVTIPGVFLASVVSRRISEPLARLVEMMHTYGGGGAVADSDYDWSRASREVSELGRTFQQMMAERRRADESLRRREAELEEAQHIAHVGSWDWDLIHDQFQCSTELASIFTATTDSFMDSYADFVNFFHEDERGAVDRKIREAIDKRSEFSFESRIRRPQGDLVFIEGRGRVETDNAGNPVRVVGVCQDVSEYHRIFEKLRLREKEFRAVLANAPVVLWALDAEGKFTLSEGKGLEHLGLHQGEVVGRSLFELYADFPEIVADAERALEGESFSTRRIVQGRTYDTYYTPRFDEAGKPIGCIGIAVDQTDKRQAEDATQRLGRLLDESFNEIYVFRADDLRFKQVNRGARENLGYTMQELAQMTPLDIKPEFTQEKFLQVVAPLREGKQERVRFHTVHQRKDGSTYPVDVDLQYSADETEPVFYAVITDVSIMKNRADRESVTV